jgi:hypothetical protein
VQPKTAIHLRPRTPDPGPKPQQTKLTPPVPVNGLKAQGSLAVIQRRVPSAQHLPKVEPDSHVVKRLRRNLMRTLEELRLTDQTAWSNIDREATRKIGKDVFEILGDTNYADLRRLTKIVGASDNLKYPGPERDSVPVDDPALSADYQKLYKRAIRILLEITSGRHDGELAAIFGPTNVATAKAKYENARRKLVLLSGVLGNTTNVVVDMTGESELMGKDGSTIRNPDTRIRLLLAKVRNPKAPASIVTLIHESLHAGNVDVVDKGYFRSPGFETRQESDKLTNAAHFEELPRRLLGDDPIGGTFVPQAIIGSGIVGEETRLQWAAKEASEVLRKAWAAATAIHENLKEFYKHRYKFEGFCLIAREWSSTLGLTIHKHPLTEVKKRGVSQLDLTLSEDVIRHLLIAGQLVNTVSARLYDFMEFFTVRTSTKEQLRDEIVRITLQRMGRPIRTSVTRDFAMVIELSKHEHSVALINPGKLPK